MLENGDKGERNGWRGRKSAVVLAVPAFDDVSTIEAAVDRYGFRFATSRPIATLSDEEGGLR